MNKKESIDRIEKVLEKLTDPKELEEHQKLVERLASGENVKGDKKQTISDFKNLSAEKFMEKYDLDTLSECYEIVEDADDAADKLFKERVAGGKRAYSRR